MRCVIVALLGVALTGGVAGAQPVEGRLKTIQETATLRIAYRTDSRPFAFVDGQAYRLQHRAVRAHRQIDRARARTAVAGDPVGAGRHPHAL